MRGAFPTWNHYGKQFQQVWPNAISRFFSFQNILNPHRSIYESRISPDSFPHSYFLKMFGIRQMNRRTCSFILENSMNLQKYGHASKAGPFVWVLWYCCHFIYWFRNNLLQQVCLALISLEIRYHEAWLMAKGFHNKEGILRLLMSGRDLMAVYYTNGEGTCTGTISLPLLRSWCKGIFPLYVWSPAIGFRCSRFVFQFSRLASCTLSCTFSKDI